MRDIQKCVNEYRRRYEGLSTTEGAFYNTDIEQLQEMSGCFINEEILHALWYALQAGFMIGYRKAQRDSRKTNN